MCNENIPLQSIRILLDHGLSIKAISVETPGISDENVLKIARQNQCIIITFDRDYGELIYKNRLIPPKGLIYLKFIPDSPHQPAEYILELLKNKAISLDGYFTVCSKDQIRQRKLPPL